MNDVEQDVPYGQLPPAQRIILDHSPLQVALVEVRFSGGPAFSPTLGLELQEGMASVVALPQVQPLMRHDVEFTVGPGGPMSSVSDQQQAGWILATADGALSVQVAPDQLVLQRTDYERFGTSLRDPLEVLLPVLQSLLSPALVQRIGLRYVNRLVDPAAERPQAWRGRIADPILGVLAAADYDAVVTATQQQLEFSLEPNIGALLRHGAFQDTAVRNAYSYLLDIDVFSNHVTRFNPDECLDTIRGLNRSALSLFQQFVTQSYRDTMAPRPVEPRNPPFDEDT